MGDDNFLIVVGVILVFPFVFYFLKVWLFATGTPGSTFHRVRRIADMDGHLSFEDRLAEKLRVAGEERNERTDGPPPAPAAPPAAAARTATPSLAPLPPKSFGRRGL